jgi:DNA-directed RNA polymerase subunit E'/Rpb7
MSSKKKSIKKEVEDDVLLKIYSQSLITRSVVIPITMIGNNIKDVIEKHLINEFEGKCIVEGFIKPNSCRLLTFSSGLIFGTNIKFEVVFKCEISFPVEGMIIKCIAKNITKAGIRADSADEIPSPIIVFITRDHHYTNKYFSEIKENDVFLVKVIGQRFELNDKYISIIAELVDKKIDGEVVKKKPKLIINDE